MSADVSSNGHHPEIESPRRSSNHYAEALTGTQPEEIVDFERMTDPYANMLPGISNINAARTIGQGVEVGKRGRPWIMAISLLLLLVLLLPAIISIVSQLVH